MKTYSELILLPTFEERFEYLRLNGTVCEETFGMSRYINQTLYRSYEWKKIRDKVILRDNGCDLGIEDRMIYRDILIHHIEPITLDDIINRDSKVFDLDNLIATSKQTHNAIHYGTLDLLMTAPVERTANDTAPWRH